MILKWILILFNVLAQKRKEKLTTKYNQSKELKEIQRNINKVTNIISNLEQEWTANKGKINVYFSTRMWTFNVKKWLKNKANLIKTFKCMH